MKEKIETFQTLSGLNQSQLLFYSSKLKSSSITESSKILALKAFKADIKKEKLEKLI